MQAEEVCVWQEADATAEADAATAQGLQESKWTGRDKSDVPE
jgi:hypothetical protein